jgi:hypothetical protein
MIFNPERKSGRYSVVRCSSAAILVTGEFVASLATRRCSPFAPPCRRSPASTRGRAVAGDDVIVAIRGGPVVDRSISAIRFRWIDLGRPIS